MKDALKQFLTKLGPCVSPQFIHNANGVLNYLYVGWWMAHQGFGSCVRWPNREALYAAIAKAFADEPVSYLEFGVYRGESLRTWCGLLKNPGSKLAGFDSFEGLPESWVLSCGKGAFDVGGDLPVFDDPRVQLVKGWFSETLKPFLEGFVPRKQLVVHLDADLYSSTIFVLRELRPWLVTGTVLIFDEFFDRQHELKALDEFLGETQIKLECLGATSALQQVAFRIVS